MSHETFHKHGATEVRLTVLQRTQDVEDIKEANPQKAGEKDKDYADRIEALHAATGRRVDFHIHEADDFLLPAIRSLFLNADEAAARQNPPGEQEKREDYAARIKRLADGHRYELIVRGGKLIKTEAEIARENRKGEDEKDDDYKARVKKLFEAQTAK